MRPFRKLLPLLLWSSLFAIGGCDPDEGRLTLRDVDRYTPALLQEVLEPAWNRGRIRHEALKGHYREALDLFAKHLEGHGPNSQPSLFRFPRQRIAFYANAYNGLALLAWLRSGAGDGDPERVWEPAWDAEPHPIDGELLSLGDLADRVREQGGREAELLLSRGRRDAPIVPKRPIDGQTFEADRLAHLRMLFNQEGIFEDTAGTVVGPAWLGTLIDPRTDPAGGEGVPPLAPDELAAFLNEHLLFDHPLRLQILRAARGGTLVRAEADPRIAPGSR